MAYNNEVCPACKSDRVEMLKKHGVWKNNDAGCDCNEQNKLWRLFEHSYLEKRFFYINAKSCLEKKTTEAYNNDIIKIKNKNYYDGMDCIMAYGYGDKKEVVQQATPTYFKDEAINTGIFFAKALLKVTESVVVFSFDYIMSNLAYTTEKFPQYLQFYKQAFSDKKVVIVYGINDSVFINNNALKWFYSLLLQRKNLTILTFQRETKQVSELLNLDKFFINMSYGIFQDNLYRSAWTLACDGKQVELVGE